MTIMKVQKKHGNNKFCKKIGENNNNNNNNNNN